MPPRRDFAVFAVWKIPDGNNGVDLLLRPDGVYSATNTTKTVRRVLRGRYTLVADQLHMVPFVGQERWVLDDANFAISERTYTLDYYEDELQIIDTTVAFRQSVRLGQQVAGSRTAVFDLVRQSEAERQQDGWNIGVWETIAPAAWMRFTFRPDQRYIAESGASGVPKQVERGQDVLAPGKITLAPYAGNGVARGFELDLYDGDLFLIGDANRLVILRKNPGSETSVIEKAALWKNLWVRGREIPGHLPQSAASWGSTAVALLLLTRAREPRICRRAPRPGK
ncbi:MAG: hypothetical protein AB9869_24100 [Verrucomicrobiia bacterium]